MKNLAHVALITVIQLIACNLADWGALKQFLSCALLYYGRDCLYGCFLKYEKNGMCRMSLNSAKASGIY